MVTNRVISTASKLSTKYEAIRSQRLGSPNFDTTFSNKAC